MSVQSGAQLNYGRTIFPCAFLGKEKNKEQGSAAFIAADGGRLSSSKLLTLAEIRLQNVIKGADARVTYELLHGKTGQSSRTIARNLKELEDDKLIERNRQSSYTIIPGIITNDYLVIYNFMLTDTMYLPGG